MIKASKANATRSGAPGDAPPWRGRPFHGLSSVEAIASLPASRGQATPMLADAVEQNTPGILGGSAGSEAAPPPEEGPEQPRDRQHDMAVGGLREHLLAQPLGPQELPFLLA